MDCSFLWALRCRLYAILPLQPFSQESAAPFMQLVMLDIYMGDSGTGNLHSSNDFMHRWRNDRCKRHNDVTNISQRINENIMCEKEIEEIKEENREKESKKYSTPPTQFLFSRSLFLSRSHFHHPIAPTSHSLFLYTTSSFKMLGLLISTYSSPLCMCLYFPTRK